MKLFVAAGGNKGWPWGPAAHSLPPPPSPPTAPPPHPPALRGQAAARELKEETSIDSSDILFTQVGAFGDPGGRRRATASLRRSCLPYRGTPPALAASFASPPCCLHPPLQAVTRGPGVWA